MGTLTRIKNRIKERLQLNTGVRTIKKRIEKYKETEQEQNNQEVFQAKQEAIKTILIIHEQLDLDVKDEHTNKTIDLKGLQSWTLKDLIELLEECITLLEQESYKK